MTTSPAWTARSTSRRQALALACLCLPVLVASMDVSVLFFAVPFIARDLAPTATQQLWIFDVYGFVLAGLLLPMGALGDRIGRRRLLLVGVALFAAASVIAAYATSATMLIVARALLGVGGATLMPSTLGLIRTIFEDEKARAKAIAVWSSVMAAGVGVGPVLSGLLLERYWWGSVFLVNLPVMALLLVAGPILLPESQGRRDGRFDLLSAVLALVAVVLLIYGVKSLASDGWSLPVLGYAVAGVASGSAFLARQRRSAEPFVDPALFGERAFVGALGINTLAMFGITGNAILLTQYLQSVLGVSPLAGALWSLAPSLLVGAAVPAAAAASVRVGRPPVMAGGFLVAALGFLTMTATRADSGVWVCLAPATLIAIGLVSVSTMVTDFVVGVVPAERASAVSGLVETTSELGGALGIALLGSVLNAWYRPHIAAALPASLPAETAHEAGQTVTGAVLSAGQLPGAVGEQLLSAARTAYTSGMHTADLVAAAILLCGALVALCLPRAGTRPA